MRLSTTTVVTGVCPTCGRRHLCTKTPRVEYEDGAFVDRRTGITAAPGATQFVCDRPLRCGGCLPPRFPAILCECQGCGYPLTVDWLTTVDSVSGYYRMTSGHLLYIPVIRSDGYIPPELRHKVDGCAVCVPNVVQIVPTIAAPPPERTNKKRGWFRPRKCGVCGVPATDLSDVPDTRTGSTRINVRACGECRAMCDGCGQFHLGCRKARCSRCAKPPAALEASHGESTFL